MATVMAGRVRRTVERGFFALVAASVVVVGVDGDFVRETHRHTRGFGRLAGLSAAVL